MITMMIISGAVLLGTSMKVLNNANESVSKETLNEQPEAVQGAG